MKFCKDSWSVVVATLALLIYGVLQERVMTRSYGDGPTREMFPHSAFLVLCNRLLTVLVLVAHSQITGLSYEPVAPVHAYCLVSASNMLSTLCQYEALKYVSFVAQTLAKTSKALPVVLWGTLVGGKRYKMEQYVHAILITGGCSVFVLGGNISSSAVASPGGTWFTYLVGMCLLLVYLAADGWTSTQQEHLFRTYNTCIREQLLFTTAFSAVYSLLATMIGGQLRPAIDFLFRHPSAALAVLGLSVMSTIIQVCISHVLQQHGALVFALMMTTRQCASVLLSSMLFGHALTVSQWVGVALVFSALYYQKSSKLITNRRSAGGKLPQSRQSAGGGNITTPLLKQVSNGNSAAALIHNMHHHKHAAAAAVMHGSATPHGSGAGSAEQSTRTSPDKHSDPNPVHIAPVVVVSGHVNVTPRNITPRQSRGGFVGSAHGTGYGGFIGSAHGHWAANHGLPLIPLESPRIPATVPPAVLLPQLSLPTLPVGLQKFWGSSPVLQVVASTQPHNVAVAVGPDPEQHIE